MHEIKSLEADWKQYKRNKRKPYWNFLGMLMFGAIFLVGFYLYLPQILFFESSLQKSYLNTPAPIQTKRVEFEVQPQPSQATTPAQPLASSYAVAMQPQIKPTLIPQQEMMTQKETESEQSPLAQMPQSYENQTYPLPQKEYVKPYEKAPVEPILELEEVESTEEPMATQPAKRHKVSFELNIVDPKRVEVLQEIESRFYASRDINDALFLAKSYYTRQMYQKSEYWAVQVNKIDDGVEDAWMIFIKSKLKRGEKSEAIRILKQYIDQSNSTQARNLLDKIKQ